MDTASTYTYAFQLIGSEDSTSPAGIKVIHRIYMHAEMLFIPLHPKKQFSRTFESPCDCLQLAGRKGGPGYLKSGGKWILDTLGEFILTRAIAWKVGVRNAIVEQLVDPTLAGVDFGQGKTGHETLPS
jgi:hypothetical protein